MLKSLIARSKIERLKVSLKPFEEKRAELETRGKQLEAAANELTDATPQDDIDALDAQVAAYEEEREQNDSRIREINDEIERQEKIIEEDEKDTVDAQKAAAGARQRDGDGNPRDDEGGQNMPRMNIPTVKRFRELPFEVRESLYKNDATHELASDFRALLGGKPGEMANRATGSSLSGVAFTIPTVYADTLAEMTYGNSVLLPLVDAGRVAGIEKMNIRVGKNEAIWMEQCQDIDYYVNKEWKQISIDVHQVAALADVCGAMEEDSDENLVAILMDELAAAKAYAIDKAIAYGRGTGMPLGIITALAYQSKPNDWPVNGLAWKDVHATNIIKTSKTGKELFAELTKAKRKLNKKFGKGPITWVMNENTRDDLMLELAGFDSSYALVSSLGDAMPLAGGKIAICEEDLLADGVILAGRYGLYRFAQRGSGPIVDISDQVKWYSGKKVIKSVDRADGRPVIVDAFMLIGINNTTPATTVSFAGDEEQPQNP